MRNLISTELKKIFKSKAAKLCFLLLTVIMFGMIIIIGSVSIAGEYNQRTLRQVLLLPYKR